MAELQEPHESVGRRTFSTSFRGFDQAEVRAYLEVLAGELKGLRRRITELEGELQEARAKPAVETPAIDVATLTSALGEETARVLRTAQEAAGDLRTRAEEGAARALKEAHDEAAKIRGVAEGLLSERTAEAELAAAHIRDEAEQASSRQRQEAAAESEATITKAIEQGRDMLAQAQAARERVLSDLARRRKLALTQLDQLRAARERLHHSLEGARVELDRLTEDLSRSDEEARLAAEAVGRQAAKGNVAPASETPTPSAAEAPVGAPEPPTAEAATVTAVSEGATGAGPAAPATTDAGTASPGEEAAPVVPRPEAASPDSEAPAAVRAEGVTRATGEEVSPAELVAEGEADARAPEEEEEEGAEEVAAEVAADVAAEGEPAADAATAPAADAAADAAAVAVAEPAPEPERPARVVRPPYPHDRVPAALLPTTVAGPPAMGSPGGKVDQLFARIRADREEPVGHAPAAGAPSGEAPAAAESATAEPAPGDQSPAPPEAPRRTRRRKAAAPPEPTPAAEPAAEEARPDDEQPDDDATLETPRSDADESYLQRRDRLVEPALTSTVRSLKRVLADDQNAVLDRLRTLRADKATADAILGDEQDQVAVLARRAVPGLIEAATAGARLVGGETAPVLEPALVAPLADRLAAEVVGGFRTRLAGLLDTAERGADTVDRLSGVYREWRGRIEAVVGDALTEAVSAGVAAALEPGTPVRWVVEDVDGPCPDCDDNALAGASSLGSPFPTGQLAPPAHPGCRCVLVQDAM